MKADLTFQRNIADRYKQVILPIQNVFSALQHCDLPKFVLRLHLPCYLNRYRHQVFLAAIILIFSLLPFDKAYCQDGLHSLLSNFSPYDFNSDGINEIDYLNYLPFENPGEQIPTDANLVLVLVEPRLLEDISGSPFTTDDLLNRLKRFKGDLRAEGYYTRFISTKVYDGTTHQDGRTLLAIRAFFQQVKASYPNFKGSVLVGSFPEAMLVRRWLYRCDHSSLTINGTAYNDVSQLMIIPQSIAERSEVVLTDLDGNWPAIYVQQPEQLEWIQAIPDATVGSNWPADNTIFSSDKYVYSTSTFEDFFWIRDDDYNWISPPPNTSISIQTFTALRNPELSSADLALSNPMARPEIVVSRINPRYIAVNPDPSFLDVNGLPQIAAGTTDPSWHRDSNLERRILIDYFDRNHDFRVGSFSNLPFRPASITYPKTDFSAEGVNHDLRVASNSFAPSVVNEDATLLDYVNWLKTPALFRGIDAHSNSQITQFGTSYTTNDLEAASGGHPWYWIQQTGQWTPSFIYQNGLADWELDRTLWENKVLAETGGNLFVHMGCQVNSPYGVEKLPYNDNAYGERQNAESVLFYLNGVAMITRAKIFNDFPRGFSETLASNSRASFGEGWLAYFNLDAADKDLKDGKRPYFWSIIGDWTVRLQNQNGLGVLSYQNGNILASNVHPNNSWIENWNFISDRNTIKGKGDFNGDGLDDFVITSDWGIGILYNNGTEWKQVMLAPKDTWFGGWRFNPGTDKVEAIADFNEDGMDDILLSSSWGIGILTFDKNTSTLTSLITYPNETRFPLSVDPNQGWLYNSRDDIIRGVGRFNNDTKPDILITSPWGIGVLSLENNSLTCEMLQPDGSQFGQWHYSKQDRILGIGRFTDDDRDDILIASDWGIGILTLSENNFFAVMLQPNDTWFGGWRYFGADDKVQGIGDFNGDHQADILISSDWGLGVLTLSGNTMTSLMVQPNGTRFTLEGYPDQGWLLNTEDNTFSGIGNFDGDNMNNDDILISSPWGKGMLKLTGNTLTALQLYSYESKLGKWYLQSQDVVVSIGNFDRQPGEDILIQKNAMSASGSSIKSATETRAVNNSINEVKPETQPIYQIKVLPNPFSQAIHVWVSGPKREPVALKIIDLSGKVVYSSSGHTTNELITIAADNKLSMGMYLLQVISKNKTQVVKILKSN